MPVDLAPEAVAGLSAAVAALTATIERAVGNWRSAAKKQEEEAQRLHLHDELKAFMDRCSAMDLTDVRAEAERTRIRDAVERIDREVEAMKERLERQGATAEKELRPLREAIAAMQAYLKQASDHDATHHH